MYLFFFNVCWAPWYNCSNVLRNFKIYTQFKVDRKMIISPDNKIVLFNSVIQGTLLHVVISRCGSTTESSSLVTVLMSAS